MKTHEYPPDQNKAIYVVRDGRAASVSLWNFYARSISLEAVVRGKHGFGKWSDHYNAWKPNQRPDTLLIKYEDVVQDLPATIATISDFLSRDIVEYRVPERSHIAQSGGRWVSNRSNWKSEMPKDLLQEFNKENGDTLKQLGYLE
jgi:hypothetical protein